MLFFWSGVTNISPSSISRSIFLLCKIEIVSYGSVNEEYSWMFDALAGQTYFVLPPLINRLSHVLTFCHIEIALCGRFHRMRCWSLSLIRHIWSCLVLLPSLTVSICLQPRPQRLLVFQYGGGRYVGKREDPGNEVDLLRNGISFFFVWKSR